MQMIMSASVKLQGKQTHSAVSSGGYAGRPPVTELVIQFLAPLVHQPKCSWPRQ